MLMSLISLFLDLLAILGDAECDKDMEIIILHQQVRILQRKLKAPPRITDPERIIWRHSWINSPDFRMVHASILIRSC
jgi:hypothetical protein